MRTSRCQQIPSPESYVSCVFCYKCPFFLIQTPAFLLGLLPVPLFLALFLSFPPQKGGTAHRKCESQVSCPSCLLCTGLARLSSVGLTAGRAPMRHSGALVLRVREPAVGYTSATLCLNYTQGELPPLCVQSALCVF